MLYKLWYIYRKTQVLARVTNQHKLSCQLSGDTFQESGSDNFKYFAKH